MNSQKTENEAKDVENREPSRVNLNDLLGESNYLEAVSSEVIKAIEAATGDSMIAKTVSSRLASNEESPLGDSVFVDEISHSGFVYDVVFVKEKGRSKTIRMLMRQR